jgi:nicotine blue oxidoreductase
VKVAGLVLAAGEGRRLGWPKALVEIDGERLVDRAVRVLRDGGCDPVVVVLGAAVVEVPGADEVVVNSDWASGMGSSVGVGLDALAAHDGVDAVVFSLVDQPRIGKEAVQRLVAAFADGARVAAATYGGRRRNPVLVASEHWDEVRRLAVGDVGARAFLGAHSEIALDVACDDIADPVDIDTAEDLATFASPPSVIAKTFRRYKSENSS